VLKGVSVALVEPEYPVNLGHVARLVRNFGVEKLYLVKPRVDMSAAAVYASHASGVLDEAEIVTIDELRARNELLVATTSVVASRRSNVIRLPIRPERLPEILSKAKSASLVFGRDSTGLRNEEIRLCDVTVTIPTHTSYRALNLGHAVAIVLYAASAGGSRARSFQSRAARETFARTLYELAVASNVQPHRTKNVLEVAKRIASASGLADRQLQFMTGVLRKAVLELDANQARDSKT